MARYLPRDWPQGVQPPGSDGWEATAVTWLFDLVPEYRQYPVVCRHPLLLAYIAHHLVHGSVEGAREGYRTARSELAEHAPPHAVDAVLDAYRVEGRRLAATERAVELIQRALRGEPIDPQLAQECQTPHLPCDRERAHALVLDPSCPTVGLAFAGTRVHVAAFQGN